MSVAAARAVAPTWRRDLGLPHQRLGEQTVVVDPRRRDIHFLNETATRVWERLASPCSEDDLVAALADEYDAPDRELREAVRVLVSELADKGLLVAP